MTNLEIVKTCTKNNLEGAEKSVKEYTEQIKRYCQYMEEETEPFKIWDTVNTLTMWNKSLQKAMSDVKILKDQIQMLEFLEKGENDAEQNND